MVEKHHPADSHRTRRLADKMRGRKDYRDSYVSSHTRQFLARQMREFRGDRSQTEFGLHIEKQQTVVSRLEDPNYGKWTLQTLFEVATKLDVAVFVRFVDFPTFMRLSKDMSDEAKKPAPYDQDAMDSAIESGEREDIGGAFSAAGPKNQPTLPQSSAFTSGIPGNKNEAGINQHPALVGAMA
jgi:hypothetical protein